MDKKELLRKYKSYNFIFNIVACLIGILTVITICSVLMIYFAVMYSFLNASEPFDLGPPVFYIVEIICGTILICCVLFNCWLSIKCHKLQLCFLKMENVTTRTQIKSILEELEEQLTDVKNKINDFIVDNSQSEQTIFQNRNELEMKYQIYSDWLLYDRL